jgi:asparagine synthase (glutamine-hydrolysing)
MSVQAGIWNLNQKTVDRAALVHITTPSAHYGLDGTTSLCEGPIGMVFRANCTTAEAREERQPMKSSSGVLLTWDGRLDNREELQQALHLTRAARQTDADLVISAFESWGTGMFSRLRGDWAIAAWNPSAMELILARDFMGIRHLFYYPTNTRIIWCTCLAPLVLCGDRFTVCNEYIAGYLAFHPDTHLSPYSEISAVPPGAFVSIRETKTTIHAYWHFNTKAKTRYKSDAEYEDHYRYLFRQAVKRRLRTDSVVVSELSGGLDSSSIVCMADDILQKREADAPRLDTFSYFDSNEPGEDDYAHLSEVEEKRAKPGFLVDLKGSGDSLPLEYSSFPPTPGFGSRAEVKAAFAKVISAQEYRVMLSGTGGDEMNGQPLDPCLLLAEMLVEGRLIDFGKAMIAWSLRMRRPATELFGRTLLQFVPAAMRSHFVEGGIVESWVNPHFAKRHRLSARQVEEISTRGLLRPSTRDALQTIETLRRQLTFMTPPPIEKRYPYLDQDLLEYLMSVPLDQLLRPGERRSLMRRSLQGLLPRMVVLRKTKAGAGRCYAVSLAKHWKTVEQILQRPLIKRLGYIDEMQLRAALEQMRDGQISKYFLRVLKALSLELWLQELTSGGIIAIDTGSSAEARAELSPSGTYISDLGRP